VDNSRVTISSFMHINSTLLHTQPLTTHCTCTGQSVLSGMPVMNRRILLEQSFTAHMPLLTVT